jgi:hypothetical protein
MLHDNNTKAQRAMNAGLQQMMQTVSLPCTRLCTLQTSDGVLPFAAL